MPATPLISEGMASDRSLAQYLASMKAIYDNNLPEFKENWAQVPLKYKILHPEMMDEARKFKVEGQESIYDLLEQDFGRKPPATEDLNEGLLTLIKNGSDDNSIYQYVTAKGIDTNYRDSDGKTALHHAAQTRAEDAPLIEYLLSVCKPDMRDNANRTALYYVQSGKRFAIENGYKIAKAISDKTGATTLDICKEAGWVVRGTYTDAQVEIFSPRWKGTIKVPQTTFYPNVSNPEIVLNITAPLTEATKLAQEQAIKEAAAEAAKVTEAKPTKGASKAETREPFGGEAFAARLKAAYAPKEKKSADSATLKKGIITISPNDETNGTGEHGHDVKFTSNDNAVHGKIAPGLKALNKGEHVTTESGASSALDKATRAILQEAAAHTGWESQCLEYSVKYTDDAVVEVQFLGAGALDFV